MKVIEQYFHAQDFGSVDETLCVTIWEKGKEQLF